jgi:hypothetical protein
MGVCVGGDLSTLALDEVGYVVSGKVTLNGALPMRGSFCEGRDGYQAAAVEFVDAAKGYTAVANILCNTPDFSFSTMLPAGTYSVRIKPGYYADSSNLMQAAYLARTALVVNGPIADLALDEVGHVVSGKVTLNGALPMRGSFCEGRDGYQAAAVEFVDAAKGYTAVANILCNTPDFSFSTMLPAGTYSVRIKPGYYADSSNLMQAAYLARTALVVNGPIADLALDEVGHVVSGKVTLNGALPMRGSFCEGRDGYQAAAVEFVDAAKGYTAVANILCNSTDFSFSTMLPAGTYSVRIKPGYYADSSNLMQAPYLAVSHLLVP